jgi:hypothetical protein
MDDRNPADFQAFMPACQAHARIAAVAPRGRPTVRSATHGNLPDM